MDFIIILVLTSLSSGFDVDVTRMSGETITVPIPHEKGCSVEKLKGYVKRLLPQNSTPGFRVINLFLPDGRMLRDCDWVAHEKTKLMLKTQVTHPANKVEVPLETLTVTQHIQPFEEYLRYSYWKRVDPNLAREWWHHDLDVYEHQYWEHDWYRISAEEVSNWNRIGISASKWRQLYEISRDRKWLDPVRLFPWVEAGFDLLSDKVWEWIKQGFQPNVGSKWNKIGCNANEAREWERRGYDLDEADSWKQVGCNPDEADIWKSTSLTPQFLMDFRALPTLASC